VKNQVRNAIEAHTKAISQWAFVDMGGQITAVLHRVKVARELSQTAVWCHSDAIGQVTDHLVDPLNQIEAACRDAEALAAIDAHADAIKLLVKS
jgi:hypothetical protein